MKILSNSCNLLVVPSGWIGIFASEREARRLRFGESFPDNSKFNEEFTPKSWLFPKEIPLEILPDLLSSDPPKTSSTL